MKITRLGLDLAKNVIQMHAVNGRGEVVVRKAFSRPKLMAYMQDLEPCLVGMEACASAHHWARCFQAMGHQVMLLAPQHVKPYVLGQKNDAMMLRGFAKRSHARTFLVSRSRRKPNKIFKPCIVFAVMS